MESRLVEVKLIDVPKTNAELQSKFNKEFAVDLATSIKAEGLYNPIVVRPSAATPGRFILVQGRHRLYATSKVLKESVIRATVIVDMDDTDAEMAMISENLWRNPLSKTQHLKALRRWHEHFKTKHPEKVGSGCTMRAASERKRRLEQGMAPNNETTAVTGEEGNAMLDPQSRAADSNSNGTASFAALVALATGKSLSTAKRDTRIARCFTAEQIEALEQMQVTQEEKTRIAKVKDEGMRGEIVSLIASGMEVEDAFKACLEADAPAPVDGKSKESREAEAASNAATSGQMTDDQWFQEYCGRKAAFLKDPARFKADAILFHRTSEQRQSFRSNSKKLVEAAKKAGVTGPFYNLLNRLINISHPDDWSLCGECKGANEVGGRKCEKCYGAGYQLKTEQYL